MPGPTCWTSAAVSPACRASRWSISRRSSPRETRSSGAFEKTSLGYTPRLPAGGRFPSKDLGNEADLELTYALPQGLQLGVGGGYFRGGKAARAFLPVEENGSWTYVELSWKK